MTRAGLQGVVIQNCDFISDAREVIVHLSAQTNDLSAEISKQLLESRGGRA